MAKYLELRKWGTLINPYENLNHNVVQEFYANAFSSEGETLSFTSMVRGRVINFNRDIINEFLRNPLIIKESDLCPYGKSLQMTLNIEEIFAAILLEG